MYIYTYIYTHVHIYIHIYIHTPGANVVMKNFSIKVIKRGSWGGLFRHFVTEIRPTYRHLRYVIHMYAHAYIHTDITTILPLCDRKYKR